ncbi:DUF2274 domain-containing protein [Allomesorhizobium camelthorni]|uniref:DUF2274 domain-containing protein n=1 Tax=Allomesorhizobium camelthorni TaxID=475069 RepID=A0A6G4WL65_9HYPH|nr:DUF2274 domain-containing protein [Mesorhizobium camelthorni]NGO54923.1 DUF2274 domain-containing protein [Mesorhizobium camelthorni]
MANLKLGKLPDRSPAKITITVSAELNRELHDYASLYRQIYGESESIAELIPFMLEAFLGSDRAFAKAKRDGLPAADISKESRRQPFSGSE